MTIDRRLIPLLILSVVSFIFLMICAAIRPYGFFIDELYFIACAKRPAFGYVDQPPLSLWMLSPVIRLFGHNILAIRALPALCMAVTVFITGLLAKQLGGSVFSMMLSGFTVAFLPIFLIFSSFYSMNAYEPLIVAATVYFLVRMVQQDQPRYWLFVSVLAGLGIMMKHTYVIYGFALVLGMFISEKRKLLFSKWLVWGGLACILIILPNLLWQIVNDFPSLELYNNSFSSKNIEKSYLEVILEQVFYISPAGFPLWITGIIGLMLRKGKPYRFMLFAYLFLITVMVASRSRNSWPTVSDGKKWQQKLQEFTTTCQRRPFALRIH
jgi:4-amino-4-deoxy-L-arabinose transferase-like glycosyltransferase